MTDEKALQELIEAYKQGRVVLRDPQDVKPAEAPKPAPKPAEPVRLIKATDEEIEKAMQQTFPGFKVKKVCGSHLYFTDNQGPRNSYGQPDVTAYAEKIYKLLPDCTNINLDGATFPRIWL